VPDVSNLAVRDLVVEFVHDGYAVRPLDGLSFDGKAGELVVLLGPSGCGKTTLLSCLGGILTPTAGSILLGDVEVTGLRGRELDQYRRERIGFVFQAFNLVPTLNAEENITLPLDIAGRDVDRAWFDTVVDTIGVRDRLGHRPNELSGGQQQRVASARAMLSRPTIVFADEPTGNLDSKSGAGLLAFLRSAVDDHGQTIVMVTHDAHAASFADRVVFLADGDVVDEMHAPTAERVLDHLKSLEG
jgi:putative ABC transport system ATP-binding protein